MMFTALHILEWGCIPIGELVEDWFALELNLSSCNIIHSNVFYLPKTSFPSTLHLFPRWNPDQQAQIVNLRAYHNGHVGISLHVDTDIRLLGGVYGDNGRRQIWNSVADDITVEGAHVVGMSLKFREALQRAAKSPTCNNSFLHGVSFSTHKLFRSSSEGMRLKDVQFSDFDCSSHSYAIHAGD